MTTPSSITQPLIEVRGLTCERGERTLFTGMSFTVAPGSLVRIAGSNGAGKTTLLRLLTGLMRPAEGEIFWRGDSQGGSGFLARALLYRPPQRREG